VTLCGAIAGVNRMPLPAAAGQGLPHARRVRAALQRGLPARAAVGTMGGGPTYVERATEGTGCLPAKLERAIDCMRLIAGRAARPSLGISVICERCLHRWLLSCSVAALWWGAEAIGLAAALR
jgi:hypothetical protein